MENIGIFMASWNILRTFWSIVSRKIWQPWANAAKASKSVWKITAGRLAQDEIETSPEEIFHFISFPTQTRLSFNLSTRVARFILVQIGKNIT
jgi:hypothetical protein